MKNNLKISVLSGEYAVHRFLTDEEIPAQVLNGRFISITRTDDELSIVCDSKIPVDSVKSEDGWACIKVLGPLDFGLTGILARIAGVLAEAEISIFAISTYDTDYIFVKKEKLATAQKALEQAGYIFEN